MNKTQFFEHIMSANFRQMFNEMGWDHLPSIHNDVTITIGDTEYDMKAVAHKSGFSVYTCEVEELPQHSLRTRIDAQFRKYNFHYILIYKLSGKLHHLWQIPIRTVEKRDIVVIEYNSVEQSEFLYSKTSQFSFELEERTNIVDVTNKVHNAFEINSARITKDFFTGFKKQHNSFVKFIQGIHIDGDRQWYASVMLNRLMFCYFIQKKGFLNFDTDYLRHKLEWTKEQRGENRFFSTFYKGFLCALFHEGLNDPIHNLDFELIYGRIPYLNGGLFDVHLLEQQYADIDISDEAFESLFAFFDRWRWHLDTRITATGRDINPDVLGYIFEQYINDRAQMGAYYTKEDITEYIGKNCIIPFLMDAVAKTSSAKDFNSTGFVWEMLRESGDRYIYDAVKKGIEYPLPDYIEQGIDTTLHNLLERRARWNEKTDELLALPTEIWRETVERRTRYYTIVGKIKNGEILHINDFITYNLDIRQFVYDLIATTTDHLWVKHFYAALQKVTILDPTCGSGAFLFAALNILEPLYEICISRMEEFRKTNDRLFVDELGEIERKYRSNIQYFIYKSIILRNLYGVDIMAEATEIAKLRLFLKMVAVVDVDRRAENMGLDPLPDIDFNIRCGNTLVGYATQTELENDLKWGDVYDNQVYKEKIETEMQKVAMVYETFKSIQLAQHKDIEPFKRAKAELQERLTSLNEVLNHRLYGLGKSVTYHQWLASYQPFHWLAEFYQIIQGNGGFDVVIGNPPYVEYSRVRNTYRIKGYKTETCGNLYAYIMERVTRIIKPNGYFSFIILMASITTQRMRHLRELLSNSFRNNYFINLAGDWHPGKLFEGVRSQFTIFIGNNDNLCKHIYTTNYVRWSNVERTHLMLSKFFFHQNNFIAKYDVYPKFGEIIENDIWKKVELNKTPIFLHFRASGDKLYYRNAGIAYYLISINFQQLFTINNVIGKSSTLIEIYASNNEYRDAIVSVLNSNLFAWYFFCFSDCYHLTKNDFTRFRIDLDNELSQKLAELTLKLMISIDENSRIKSTFYKSKGEIKYQEFYPRFSKPIIDEIDKVLAYHYGLTEEELDYIINYDIKYRMGSELNEIEGENLL